MGYWVKACMKQWLILLIILLGTQKANTQIIYATQGDVLGVNLSFGTLDLSTCVYTELNPGPIIEFQDFCLGPNGEIYVSLIGVGLGIYNVATNTSTLIVPIPNFLANSMEILPNGLIYAAGSELWEIDPVAGTFANLGTLSYSGEGDLAYINGQLYLTGNNGGGSCLVLVDIANPGNSTCVTPLPYTNNTGLINVPSSTCGDQLYGTGVIIDPITFGISSYAYAIDLGNNTVTEICAFSGIGGYADFAIPFDYDFPGPCCVTDAGSIDPGAIQSCVNQLITLQHNGDEVLDNNDALQFAISSSVTNPTGNIIVRQNSNTFSFQPGIMVPGVTYYAFALAGNNLGGGIIDLNDPCLDISNVIELVWNPLPSVTFSSPGNICGDNGCFDVQAQFIGTPPFVLNYTITNGSGTLLTGVFNGNNNNGTINVCLPVGAFGPMSINATQLTDAVCTCN